MTSEDPRPFKKGNIFPWHGRLGLLLVIIFWILNWTLPGLRTHWGFFPLWLGYCLTVDGIVFLKRGDSLLVRDHMAYGMLFVISMPGWWLFELLNLRLQNWVYLGMENFSHLEYFLLSSMSFSTVMPAVFGTAELIGSFHWIQKIPKGPMIHPSPRNLIFFWNYRILNAHSDVDLASIFFPVCLAEHLLLNRTLESPCWSQNALRLHPSGRLAAFDGTMDGVFDLWFFLGILEFLVLS